MWVSVDECHQIHQMLFLKLDIFRIVYFQRSYQNLCVRRAELILKCMKGIVVELSSWSGAAKTQAKGCHGRGRHSHTRGATRRLQSFTNSRSRCWWLTMTSWWKRSQQSRWTAMINIRLRLADLAWPQRPSEDPEVAQWLHGDNDRMSRSWKRPAVTRTANIYVK